MIEHLLPPLQPRIIALHGAVANAATWLPLQRVLGETVEFIAPDLPGHGTRRQTRFSIEASLRLIEESLVQDERAPRVPVLLVGDSLGGYLALIAASRFGNLIDGVIVGGATYSTQGSAGFMMQLSDLPVSIANMLLGRERLEAMFQGLLTRLTDPATAEAIVARGLCLPSRSESIRELSQIDILALIKSISVPIYFVNGALDIPTQWYTRAFAGYAREGYAAVIPAAWHGCMLTHADECSEIVRTALLRVQRNQATKFRHERKALGG